MLITPAIASEPYWADAPSLNTSIFSIANAGIAFKSVPTDPLPGEPLMLTNEEVCLLFPLIN
jgi:hypothetical protein